ncbi:ABC-2 family transporter permease [Granulicella aggregans]|uniref:hypothetical protein n=1 Tax=Granulicella aggregans TaxID=474949 RepID=UPI0021DF9D9E|nr:hypothetical protein [Granulicella aggregans]
MNQTLHIFAKDTRRFWIEILISLALLAAFAHVSLFSYQPGMPRPEFFLYPIFNIILIVLIPITWWILVSRVVHEENLVGDRQFWITRPYRWPSLLGAKILFLVAYVLLPIGLLQTFVLAASGFHVSTIIPGLLFSVALFGVLVILPLFALSTVTSSFARLTVSLLAIFLGVLLFGALVTSRAQNVDLSVHAAWPYLALSLVASIAIIGVQYSMRRTLIARSILLASLILLILLPVFFATTLTPLYFPSASASRPAPVTFTFDPDPRRHSNGIATGVDDRYVSVSLPVVVSGVAPNALAVAEGIKVTLTSSDGKTYSSPWRAYRTFYSSDSKLALQYVPFLVPTDFFEHARSTAVTAHITLGVSQLKSQPSITVPFPSEKTEIPGIGICAGTTDGRHIDRSHYGLACTLPLRSPAYTEISVRWSDNRCEQPQPPSDQLIPGKTSVGSFDSDPADFGLSPLIQQPINFSNGLVALPNNASRPRFLCSGTPLTLTPYSLTYRASVDFTAPNLNLANYLPKSEANIEMQQFSPDPND